tara:strand:- start:88 stop:1428 length:1341 start_codon:yes stop_codon:yes gene_type:complete
MDRKLRMFTRSLIFISVFGVQSSTSFAEEKNGVNGMASQSRLANVVETPSSVGYYIRTANDEIYPIEQYIVRGELGLNKLADVSHIPVSEASDIDGIEIVINIDNVVDLQRLAPRFFAQSAAISNPDFVKALEFNAEQIAENLFRIQLTNVEMGDIITVVDNNMVYAISMGEITENLVNTFSVINWPAHEITYSLEQALKSFPENQPMKDLLAEKLKDKGSEKLTKISQDIDSKLNNFNSVDRHASKLVHAEDVLHEINYFEAVSEELGLAVEQRIVDLKSDMQAFIDTPEATTVADLDTSKIGSEVTYYQTSNFGGTATGAGNVVVSVVAVGSTDLLIRFRGIGNEFEGKVLRASKEITNDSLNTYIAKTTEVTGTNWNLFMYENDGWGGASFSAYPPAIQDKVDLYRTTEDKVQTTDSPQALLDDYMPTSGSVEAVAESSDLAW